MGLAQRIRPRDLCESAVVKTQAEKIAAADAIMADLVGKEYYIVMQEEYTMPSASDDEVIVVHIYYRKVDKV